MAAGSMTVILMEAIKPNLMQTLENTPALVHTGPFGNIATGNSSIVADQIGIHMNEFLLTEAGFGADMGAERFFNIKCRYSGIAPDAAVLVATVRGLKAHSGNHRIVAGQPLPEDLLKENPDEVHQGGDNLRKQLENMKVHGVTPVVAINAFPGDHDGDINAIREIADEYGARAALSTHFADGGKGATELASAVKEAAEEESNFEVLYPDDMPVARQDPSRGRQGLRSRRRGVLPDCQQAARHLRSGRVRQPSRLYRQDPLVNFVGPQAQGCTHRLDPSGPRGSGLRWRRLRLPDLWRHADHARPRQKAGRHGHRHR